MGRLRYNVAASLDGFIAGPHGEYDWIVADPTVDFAALFAQFDAFVMGRRTFEMLRAQGDADPTAGREILVASRTLRPDDRPGVTIVGDDVPAAAATWKAKFRKDLWLFGGGALFRTLLDAGLVDTVEVALVPVMLGAGIPLLTPGHVSPPLRLAHHESLPSGIVMLTYEVANRRTGCADPT